MDKSFPTRKWTDVNRKTAVAVWIASENIAEVSRVTGIPSGTIQSWVKTKWWGEYEEQIYLANAEDLEAELSAVIRTGLVALKERIKKGDAKLSPTGKIVNVPVTAAALNIIVATAIDKRTLVRAAIKPKDEAKSLDDVMRELRVVGKDQREVLDS